MRMGLPVRKVTIFHEEIREPLLLTGGLQYRSEKLACQNGKKIWRRML
jgi:hypothetical protein